ncbi:MBL fold metallo-hydrolase [Pontibacter sp. BT310]|uniref:MBL fold metallo-hydrolase n=2 Tax=Hymenobacteraceae TaxID=1853232 RepID=A0ABS6XG36_9BACT|nr:MULTISPECIES: MBL fold metallo-hydrolase [Pontibacter]MBJ6120019.1 MBL fold metallo-hydrolase [Pontibacter sp. BT310]MBW3366872.1 MBL fold metallo-hydrolase [Pontibacter populi]
MICCLALLHTYAQPPKFDMVKTNKGQLKLQPITHGSLVLSWNGMNIYVDPYGGADAYKTIPKPDLVLITDIHGDHLDPKTLDALDLKVAKFVVPQAVADQLPEKYKGQAIVIGNGEDTTLAGIAIEVIAMYNLPEAPDAKHPKGRGNGYILTLGGKRIYISGDTEDIPEMRALKNIDVAFVSMNLPYTMDIDQAASGVLAFKPKVIYPYHYRGTEGLADVEAFKKMVNEKDKNIDVRLRNWYPQQQQKK